MSIFQIREARRSGARLVIGLAGQSGTGKTFTGLQLAWGLANFDSKKVGFIDTENKRGSLYSDALKDANGQIHRFLIGDLYAPFSPDRYIQAIKAFEAAGVEVLVIDSVTHEWEGIGGCQEIAAVTGSVRMPNWAKAKEEHKRFMNTLLQCDMHIIVCVRAREKVEITKQKNPQTGKVETLVTPIGIQPICEGNFMFEMTASCMMHDEGTRQDVLKCPAELRPLLGRAQGYITPNDGKALRDWVDGAGSAEDAKLEKWRNSLRGNCEQGLEHLKACWEKTPAPVRKQLGAAFLDELKASATAYDNHRNLQSQSQDPDVADAIGDLNSQILANTEAVKG
jgi:hypothetical protein